MVAIIKELTIVATTKRVFDALTQQDEIAQWWTDDLSVKPEIGSLAEFRFQRWGGSVLQFEIVELEVGKSVSWVSRKVPPAWAGTYVTWQLHAMHNGTQLNFTHEGFTKVDIFYENTRKNWEYFLNSLKLYLETGKGSPKALHYLK